MTNITTFPGQDRLWKPDYESDIYGSIVAGKNLDFRKKGYLALAKKAMVLYTEADDGDFTSPIAMAADDTNLYVTTSAGTFIISLSSLPLTVTKYTDDDKPNASFGSDIEFFNNLPHFSGGTSVSSYDDNDFTERITGLDDSFPHPMARHGGRNTLLVADGNVLRQYSSAWVEDTDNNLTIPAEYVITRVIYKDSTVYVLTRNAAGGSAKVFKWSGAGVGNNGEYGVQADWIYSGCEYESTVAIITSAGQLLQFTGAGFQHLADLPVYFTNLPWTSSAATSNLIGNVASRGMEASGDVIYLNINGALNVRQGSEAGRYLANMPSGLWKYDPSVGLYHVAGANYDGHKAISPSAIESNRLVFGESHGAQTGDALLCVSVSGLSELTAGHTYYALVDEGGTTALRLALSPAAAKNGNAIELSGTPSVGDVFAFDSYGSVGSGQVSNAGPVLVLKGLVPDLFYGSEVLFGARAIDNSLSGVGSLMSLGLGRNVGYFVTPKIASGGISETFERFVQKLQHLNLPADSITVKFRTSTRFGLPNHTAFTGAGATFASPTTFTVDPGTKDVEAVQVGDEVEFIQGAACGYLAHVTAIDTTDPESYVFTIDETLPVSSGDQCDFLAENWTKISDIATVLDPNNAQNFFERPIGKGASWIQFKVALAGRNILMEQFLLLSSPNNP